MRRSLLGSAHYYLYDFWEDHSAPEVKGEFKSPAYLVPIVALYLWFVLSVGPRFMSGRKPYDVSFFMKWYNYANIAANFVLFLSGLWFTRLTYDCWFCQPCGPYLPHWVAKAAGLTYMGLKVFDLLDTVFFVLRKKWNQVTPLHVIHHSIMPFTAYIGLKIAFGPGAAIVLILNSFVHTIMYYYYHLASLGHRVWWKKHITLIQLIQFYITFTHAAHTFFVPGCNYPKWVALLQMTEASYFTVSFTRFYIKEYLKDKNVQTKATVDDLILSADKDFGNNKNGTNKLIVSEVSKKID